MATRAEVSTAARSLIGTPFRHQGRLPGVVLDCLGVIQATAHLIGEELEDPEGYPRFWEDQRLYEGAQRNLIEISPVDAGEGDILMFWLVVRRVPIHSGIQVSGGRMVHAWDDFKKVLENTIDKFWERRIYAAFRFKTLEV